MRRSVAQLTKFGYTMLHKSQEVVSVCDNRVMAEAGCAVQASCGGCPMLSLDRATEIEKKTDVVAARLGAVGVNIAVDFDTVGPRFGYRNRLRMKVTDGRADFFNDAKRDGCPVVRPELWRAIEHLRRVTNQNPMLLGSAEHLEVRVGDRGGLGLALPVPVEMPPLEQALGPAWVVAHIEMEQPPTLEYQVASDAIVHVPITSFVQVNSDVNRQLVRKVLAVAKQSKAKSFIDLFSGAGNFAIPLARTGLTGIAVENAGAAMAELSRSGAAQAGMIRCIEGDARTVLAQLDATDLVIADPPRAGIQHGYDELARLACNTLIVIGCKASAFATDVAALCQEGLTLESVTAFDMFPGTRHVETLAVFKRQTGATSFACGS